MERPGNDPGIRKVQTFGAALCASLDAEAGFEPALVQVQGLIDCRYRLRRTTRRGSNPLLRLGTPMRFRLRFGWSGTSRGDRTRHSSLEGWRVADNTCEAWSPIEESNPAIGRTKGDWSSNHRALRASVAHFPAGPVGGLLSRPAIYLCPQPEAGPGAPLSAVALLRCQRGRTSSGPHRTGRRSGPTFLDGRSHQTPDQHGVPLPGAWQQRLPRPISSTEAHPAGFGPALSPVTGE